MAHPALETQRREAALDQHGRAGVAKGVEADPGETSPLGGWYKDSVADVAWVQRRASVIRKDKGFLS